MLVVISAGRLVPQSGLPTTGDVSESPSNICEVIAKNTFMTLANKIVQAVLNSKKCQSVISLSPP